MLGGPFVNKKKPKTIEITNIENNTKEIYDSLRFRSYTFRFGKKTIIDKNNANDKLTVKKNGVD